MKGGKVWGMDVVWLNVNGGMVCGMGVGVDVGGGFFIGLDVLGYWDELCLFPSMVGKFVFREDVERCERMDCTLFDKELGSTIELSLTFALPLARFLRANLSISGSNTRGDDCLELLVCI